MNCPKCFSPLELFKKKYICSNENCDYVIKAEEIKNETSQWTHTLFESDELWYKEAFDNYPSVVAHEYYRVYDMMGHNQSYGAFWQLKDLLEVMLKFPVLSAVSQVFNRDREEYTPVEQRILKTLIGKTLSLGHWVEIASLLKGIKYIDKGIKKILSGIFDIYNDNGIVHWRNKQIGHGALPMDTDMEFQREIVNILAAVKKHFIRCDSCYRNLKVHPAGKEEFLLKGRQYARDIDHDSFRMELCVNEGKVDLFPYILLNNRGIYFYDTYYSMKKKTAILDYPDGKKDDDNSLVNEAIIGKYGDLLMDLIDDEGSIDDRTYSLQDELLIEQMGEIDDFQSPAYLKDWLEESMEKHDRGVFLLQMERGTGKTTFARGLDELSIGKIKLKGTSARGYYINNTFKYKDVNFRQGICDTMKKSGSGMSVIRGIEDLTNRVSDKGQEFARFLNEYSVEYSKRFSKTKLMVVLDGLDEIPAGDNIQIFDYIPSPGLLYEGVYILATCRTDEELSSYTLQRLKDISFTDSISLCREQQYNREVLNQYIKTKIFKLDVKQDMSKAQQKIASIMIQKSGERFLYLKTLKELMIINPTNSFNGDNMLGSLPDGEELFGFYLDRIESLYGKKYFSHIYSILVILAASFEPLTLREISYLLGEDRPTFRVLAYMEELKGFLSVERSERGNLFSIAHEEWIDYIKTRFQDRIPEMVLSWAKRVKSFKDKKIDWEKETFDGEVYISSAIGQYIEKYCSEDICRVFAIGDFSIFLDIAKVLYKKSCFKYHQYRAISLLSTCEKLLRHELKETSNEEERTKVRHDLSICLSHKGNVYTDMGSYPEALKAFDESLYLYEQNRGFEEFYDLNHLAELLMNRGDAHENLENFKEAMADNKDALAILLELKECGKLEHMEAINRAYYNLGEIYYDIYSYKEAVEAYTKGIEIMTEIAQGGKIRAYNMVAYLLTSRGDCYDTMGYSEKALEDYNEALRIRTDLDSKGMLRDKNQIGQVLSNRSIAYREVDPEKSLEDINQAINMLKAMERDGKAIDLDSLVYRLRLRAKTYRFLKDYVNAERDYKEALEILKRITEDDDWTRRNNLADLYDDYAHLYLGLKNNENAAVYFEMGISLQEELEKENRLFEAGDLTKSWFNYGVTLEMLKNYEEAINCYTKSIEHARNMKSGGKYINAALLAKAAISRGAMYLNIMNYKMAMEGYEEAVSELSNHKSLIPVEEYDELLARAYSGKGNILKINRDYENALKCIESSIMLMKSLESRGELKDRAELIAAMYDRADIYSALGQREKARTDLKVVIKEFTELDHSSISWSESWLINAVYLLGEIYYDSGELSQGIAQFTKLLQYAASNDTRTWVLKYRDAVYRYRSIFHVNSDEYEMAVEDLTECIEIKNKLESYGGMNEPKEFARAHVERAYGYLKLGMGEEACEDLEIALSLFYQTVDKKNKVEVDELLRCAVQLTQTLQDIERIDQSRAVMDKAVDFAEGTQIKSCLVYGKLQYLAAGYYEEKGDIEKQQEHLYMIIDILTGYTDSETGGDTDYEDIYSLLSEVSIDLELTEANIKYMDRVIEYAERLKSMGLILDFAPLGSMYMHRGIMYHNIQEDEKALVEYREALDITGKIYDEGCLDDINDLALVYLNMSLAHLSQKRYDETIVSAQKALSLWEEAGREEIIEEGCIIACINLGNSYYYKEERVKAVALYDKSISIYLDIESKREVEYRDLLMESFKSCCIKDMNIERILKQLKG